MAEQTKQPVLIFLNGLPAAGKTTFGQRLSRRLGFPFLSKDLYKEALGDALGGMNYETSRQYGKAAYRLLLATVERILTLGTSCIIESIFRPEDETVYGDLVKRHQVRAVLVEFVCDPEVLYRRFVVRMEKGERHPVHMEHHGGLAHLRERMSEGAYRLKFAPVILRIDTTDVDHVDWEAQVAEVERQLINLS